MATIHLPTDFREFVQLLNARDVEYLVIGGYAVGIHGYPRSTGDLDIWISREPANAEAMAAALREFGFADEELSADLFMEPEKVIRLGVPPVRIEVHTSISGVEFADCYAARATVSLGDLRLPLIGLDDLKTNKRSAGRHKDLDDLENLP